MELPKNGYTTKFIEDHKCRSSDDCEHKWISQKQTAEKARWANQSCDSSEERRIVHSQATEERQNENGNSTHIEVAKRVSPWFWTDNNKTFVQIRYGTRVLELQKGKNTIETASADDLVKTLGIVRTCVANGELDSVIEAASVKVRERFGK